MLDTHLTLRPDAPSLWVVRHAAHIAPGGTVLDLACGGGRNARWLARQGFVVEAVDRNTQALSGLAGIAGIHATAADLEAGDWPYLARQFDAIVVCRYLHRPLLPVIATALNPGGVLIYETFMVGNERFGKPSNPDFLLHENELMAAYSPLLRVAAFEQGVEAAPRPAAMQRICAIRENE